MSLRTITQSGVGEIDDFYEKIDRYKFNSFRRQTNLLDKTLPDKLGWLEPQKLVYTAGRKILNQAILKQ